jgi:uncharacterized protein (TIGR02186 family)
MPSALFLLIALLSVPPAWAQDEVPSAYARTRRVTISLTFSGEQVFLYGRNLPGSEQILAVMEGPVSGPVRLMEKGRVALFWLGIRQYKLTGVPGVYLVNATPPTCNGRSPCPRPTESAAWTRSLASAGFTLGPEAIRPRARLESLSGDLAPGEVERILEGYWRLQASRGLYETHPNAIRISRDGTFYHSFAIPTEAPEGKYRITTYFLAGDRLIGKAENDLFVRKSGFVAWLSRMAERQAPLYGVSAVLIAVSTGWLAGAIFRRSGGH